MARWTLDDIPWHRFDAAKLDPELVRLAKAASLVEANGAAYAHHLCRVFEDDPEFQADARRWGAEEVQHGAALGRWAALADPKFDFARALDRFRAGYRADFASGRSRRGSRSGEMVARCMVETGTSTYYAALGEAADEPVLKEICRRIAADEVRHYKLFHRNLMRCLARERIGFWRRLRVAAGRAAELGDDELAWAYHAANETDLAYDRWRCARAYASGAYALYRARHVTHAVALIFNALGLAPKGRLARLTSRLVWAILRRRTAHPAAGSP